MLGNRRTLGSRQRGIGFIDQPVRQADLADVVQEPGIQHVLHIDVAHAQTPGKAARLISDAPRVPG